MSRLKSVERLIKTGLPSIRNGRKGLDLDPLIRQIKSQRLTFLDAYALRDLQELAMDIEHQQLAGSIVEAGCALGGSAILLARTKSKARCLFVYDVFGMIPPPTELDGEDVHERYANIVSGRARGIGRNDRYYGYEEGLIRKVESNFRHFAVDLETDNVTLVKGLFQETLYPDGPICLAHIDADWYESVKVCLERIWPALVPGGVIVVDDYDSWSGCHRAVEEFRSETFGCEIRRRARLQLVKSE